MKLTARMKPTEKLATVISVIALLLSSINTYYQFFHVRHALMLSSYDLMARRDGYYAELAISNTGNRPVAAMNINLCMMREDAVAFETAGSWSYVDTYVDDVQSDIVLAEPITVIPPGEIRVVRLKSKFEFSEKSAMLDRSFNIGICLTVYTSEARKRMVGLMPFWLKVDDQGKPSYPERGAHFQAEHRKKIDL